jgi:hypothetical protein
VAVPDVLRWNDGAAQVKAGRAIEVADGCGDGDKIGLGDFFPEIRLISRCELIGWYRQGAGHRDLAQLHQRFRIRSRLRPR